MKIIIKLLAEAGLTKEEVSQKMGIDASDFGKLMVDASVETIEKLANVLGVPACRLFGGAIAAKPIIVVLGNDEVYRLNGLEGLKTLTKLLECTDYPL